MEDKNKRYKNTTLEVYSVAFYRCLIYFDDSILIEVWSLCLDEAV